MGLNERFAVTSVVPKEATHDYEYVQFVHDQMNHELAEKAVSIIQTGELVLTVKDLKIYERPERGQIEYRKEIKVSELVRCKDCKCFARIKDEKSGVIHSECIRTWAGITEHDFCSYGEREDDYGPCLPMSEKDFYTRSKFR